MKRRTLLATLAPMALVACERVPEGPKAPPTPRPAPKDCDHSELVHIGYTSALSTPKYAYSGYPLQACKGCGMVFA